MRFLPLILLATLSACVRNQASSQAWGDEDTSIHFPHFYERFAVMVAKEGEVYDMDGETLRAINIAASDFIRPRPKNPPCWETREAHRYRVIRRGDILFVQVYLDPDYCKMGFGILDYGVAYAISTDGRILRRLYAGEPDDLSGPQSADAGELGPEYDVDPSRLGQTDTPVDCEFLRRMTRSAGPKSSSLPESCQMDGGSPSVPSAVDAGAPPPASSQVDGGTPPTR